MKTFNIGYGDSSSVSRVLAGFLLLESRGTVKLSLNPGNDCPDSADRRHIVQLEADGLRLAFNMADNGHLSDETAQYLDGLDGMFLRSYNPEMNKNLREDQQKKLFPFGFNYYATCPGNPLDKKENAPLLQKLKQAVKNLQKADHVESFEQKADYVEKDPKIIFMCRLWDPEEIPQGGPNGEYRAYMREERHKLCRDRIDLVRSLGSIYGSQFTGGIQDTPLARKLCPELIVPNRLTNKQRYLAAMKRSDICIGSMGLHRSTGWKTGEYIAAARAIVAEKMWYDVPGDFAEGKNFLEFSTTDQALTQVERLYKDPDLLYNMKKANELYYARWLRPEQQLCNALAQFSISL